MKPSLYKVTKVGKGTLFVMPKPSTDWLEDDVSYLQNVGVTKVLSLLEKQEERELGLEKEEYAFTSRGIEFESFPIKDRGLPDPRRLRLMLPQWINDLYKGKNLSIHCRGGIGRTGIVSCCLLIKNGLSAAEAIELVSRARQCGIPDTEEQKQFIRQFND